MRPNQVPIYLRPAPAAVGGTTLVQSSGTLLDHANSTGSKTFTNAVAVNFTASNSAVFACSMANTSQLEISGVTIGGTAATKVKDFNNTNNSAYWGSIWFVQSMAGGTRNIVVTYGDSSASYVVGSVEEWANMPASAFDATANGATGERIDTSVTTTLTITSGSKAQNKEIVYAIGYSSKTFASVSTIAGPSGGSGGWVQTALQNTGGTDIGCSAGYTQVNGAGTESATFTITTGGATNEIDAVLATFKSN